MDKGREMNGNWPKIRPGDSKVEKEMWRRIKFQKHRFCSWNTDEERAGRWWKPGKSLVMTVHAIRF